MVPSPKDLLVSPRGHRWAQSQGERTNCVEMAREFPEPDKKLALLDMANAWLRLDRRSD